MNAFPDGDIPFLDTSPRSQEGKQKFLQCVLWCNCGRANSHLPLLDSWTQAFGLWGKGALKCLVGQARPTPRRASLKPCRVLCLTQRSNESSADQPTILPGQLLLEDGAWGKSREFVGQELSASLSSSENESFSPRQCCLGCHGDG